MPTKNALNSRHFEWAMEVQTQNSLFYERYNTAAKELKQSCTAAYFGMHMFTGGTEICL